MGVLCGLISHMVSIQKTTQLNIIHLPHGTVTLEESVHWLLDRNLSNLPPEICSPSSRTYCQIQLLTSCIYASMQIYEILLLNGLDAAAPNSWITLQLAHVCLSDQVPLPNAKLQLSSGSSLLVHLTVIESYPTLVYI